MIAFLLYIRYGFTIGVNAIVSISILIWLFVYFSNFVLHSKNGHLKKIYKYISALVIVVLFVIIGMTTLICSELHSKIDDYSNVDFAIVLGAGIKGDELTNHLKRRLDLTYSQLKDNNIPIILSGGQGPDEWVSEAEAMSRYLVNKGISVQRLIIEDKSTSTQENIAYSNTLMNKKGVNVVVFTSDYHMYRTKMLGRRVGWKTEGYSAINPFGTRINCMFREICALMKDMMVYEF